MITIVAFLVALGVLVVFHELGHFWVARRCDVKVLRFSVGFGKVLWAKRFGETEWALSAVPLGGYVKMLDEREGEVAPEELGRAFNRKPAWQRMLIVLAGPVANLVLAVILYWVLFMHGVPGIKPMLGEIAPNTPAAAAKLEPGETITSLNGEAIPSWQDMHWELLNLALQRGVVAVEGRLADGTLRRHELDLSAIKPSDLDGDFMQKLGLQPYQPLVQPVIGKVLEGSVAERAGLRAGDLVKSADGRAMNRWEDWVEAVRSHPAQTLHVQIERAGHELALDITPEASTEAGKQVGKIGAAPKIDEREFAAMLVSVSYGPLQSVVQSLRKTWETGWISLKMMGKMVVGEVSVKNISGPITIADYAGQSAHLGLGAYLGFLALISISLGVLNLLPIPLLDGGHLLYYTVELVKGSPVSEKAWQIGQNIGIALLATLMAFALYNDISRLIFG
jgi:regulator of sigma E protease